ncbi:MAG: hypothetical protein H0U27_04730 [Nitrosopumilus sp.]|nr:hypothetical protein [Nitrosopumilus sp.]
MKTSIDRRAARNKFYCPPEFLNWIKLVNYCPDGNEFLKIKNILEQILSGTSFIRSEKIQLLKDWMVLHRDPISKRNLIEEYRVMFGKTPDLIDLFELLSIARTLRDCADSNRKLKKINSSSSNQLPLALRNNEKIEEMEGFDNDVEWESIFNVFQSSPDSNKRFYFELNLQVEPEKYSLKPLESKFIILLKRENIDVRNIKLCVNCKKNIFWKQREKQATCSRRCSKHWAMKKLRKKENKDLLNQKGKKD